MRGSLFSSVVVAFIACSIGVPTPAAALGAKRACRRGEGGEGEREVCSYALNVQSQPPSMAGCR